LDRQSIVFDVCTECDGIHFSHNGNDVSAKNTHLVALFEPFTAAGAIVDFNAQILFPKMNNLILNTNRIMEQIL
jgi:hypothetical protein